VKRILLVATVIALTACNREQKHQIMVAAGGGNADRGKQLITQYGCNSCHIIPGIEGAKGMVGPPLEHIGSRQIIAGKLQNTPQNMTQWLQNPQAIDPQNAMPNLGVKPDEARDITAYLVSLK
jgi:cytochrome c